MRLHELFEISANPDYLHAAERSRSMAQATQRTFGTSPEEKAAARRTELKRDKGIAGYAKRHKAAHPEMYPKVTPQPARQLRDPSTEYSDDYSVWAAGQRDFKEQSVPEGSVSKKPQPYNDPNWVKKLSKEKLNQLAGPQYSKHEKKLISKMSDAEKVDKGWRNPNTPNK